MIRNLLIIGNGFDLAHGLKTSYHDFIRHSIEEKQNNVSYCNKLFPKKRYQDYDSFMTNIKVNSAFTGIKNHLLLEILRKEAIENWCDIEGVYFQILNETKNRKGNYSNIKKLNDDFQDIKDCLGKYLLEEQKKFKSIETYHTFLNKFLTKNTLIVNFNYTDILNQYFSDYEGQMIHIHGELQNESNPIIFGFAANNEESRELINIGDREYIRNIKKHNYKRTNNRNILKNFLNNKYKIEVSILGHSCGISDKLILHDIFNHDNISKIRIFYHKDYEHFFNTQHSIDRIMNNDINFEKLVNFQESIVMPQHDDEHSQQEKVIQGLRNMFKQQEGESNKSITLQP